MLSVWNAGMAGYGVIVYRHVIPGRHVFVFIATGIRYTTTAYVNSGNVLTSITAWLVLYCGHYSKDCMGKILGIE